MSADPLPAGPEEKERRREFFSRAAAHCPYIGVDTIEGRFIVGTVDEGVGQRLFVDRRRGEMRTLERALAALAAHDRLTSPGETTFIDVGANIGTSCIPALLRHGFLAGLAFEPHPTNFRLLRANAMLNGVADRLETRCVALSDGDGSAELLVDGHNSGAHRICRDGIALDSDDPDGKPLAVDCSTLDSVWAEASERLPSAGLVWVDAQGHEGAIFEGGAELLRSGPPIVFEVWPEGLAAMGGIGRVVDALSPFYSEWVELRQSADGPARPLDQLAALPDEIDRGITDVLVLP